jgi:hypothetical protein
VNPQDIPDDAWELPIEVFRRKPDDSDVTLSEAPVGERKFAVEVYRPYGETDSMGQLVVYAPDLLPRQSESGWYVIPIYPISPFALNNRVPCDREDYSLDPVPDNVAALYQPPMGYGPLVEFTRLEELSLADLELLVQTVLVKRNLRSWDRRFAASALGISNRLRESDTGPWYYTTPDVRAEEAELKKLEPKPDPAEGRSLETIEPDADGLVRLPVEQGMALKTPVWEAVKDRAKNWGAVIKDQPSQPGGLGRDWLPRPRKGEPGRCRVSDLRPGQVLEFAADYQGRHGLVPTRWYGIVVSVSDSEIALRPAETAVAAFAAGKAMNAESTYALPWAEILGGWHAVTGEYKGRAMQGYLIEPLADTENVFKAVYVGRRADGTPKHENLGADLTSIEDAKARCEEHFRKSLEAL